MPFLGDARFQQAAGFLRIPQGTNPLDETGVHPEAYGLVKEMTKALGLTSVQDLMRNGAVLKRIKPTDFVDEKFGVLTIRDILAELEKPARDPRAEFKTASFKDDVQTIDDLRPGMKLEGVVANVAAFGAFVDIGVHVNGLVHVSALADHFVKDPREEVRVGQVVHVVVIEVDPARQRIALSMRSDGKGGYTSASAVSRKGGSGRNDHSDRNKGGKVAQTALGAAFAALKR